MECSNVKGIGVEDCAYGLKVSEGRYSFNIATGRCELNGNLYGHILSYTESSFTIKRISDNQYINGMIQTINIID